MIQTFLKRIKQVRSQQGFTLIELTTTMFITALTSVAAGAIVIWLANLSNFMIQKNHAEQNLMQTAARIKSVLAMAINVGNNGVVPGALCTAANPTLSAGGCFTTGYNMAATYTQPASAVILSAANLNGQVDTIARFYREGGVISGQVQETAIFFRRPDITAQYDDQSWPSGAIFISSITPSAAAPVPILVGPNNEIFDSLTNLTIETSTVADPTVLFAGNPVQRTKSATITLTARYFSAGNSANWMYCPVGMCTINVAFKDESLTVTANFVNNVLHVGNTLASGDAHTLNTLFGNIYFLQPQLPTE